MSAAAPPVRGTGALEVAPAVPTDHAELDAWVLASPASTFWHRPGWMRAVARVFRVRDCTLVARRGGRIVGSLPLGLCPTLGMRRNLVSVPYGVYGGVAADDADAERALFDRARQIAAREDVGYLELRQIEARVPGLVESDLYVTFVRDLPKTPDDALAMLPRKARAAARQARDRHELVFDEGLWHLGDLHRLFSINKRHLGSPPLPRAFFEALRDEMKGHVHVHLVRHGKEPIAAVMSFDFGDTLLPYYSGGLQEYEPMQCNNFLYWKLMEWAIARGFRRFDYGRSRRDSGPYHFKKNQGFEPTPLRYGYHFVRSRGVPRLNPSNPVFDVPRRVWRRLPLALHEALGERLSRYLP